MTDSQSFEMRLDVIDANGDAAISAWNKVLRAILPILVQDLPAEEYQVVRSTEHTDTVTKRAKGIVAGAEILESSFSDLRGILKQN
jgi:hypothetical protein